MDESQYDTSRHRPNSLSQDTTSRAINHAAGPPSSSPSALSSPSRTRQRGDSAASNIGRQLRRASRTFEESNLPEGFLSATGDFASTILLQDPGLSPELKQPPPISPAPASSPASQTRTRYSYGKPSRQQQQQQQQVPSAGEEGRRELVEGDSRVDGRPPGESRARDSSSPLSFPPAPSTDAVPQSNMLLQRDMATGSNSTDDTTEPYDNGYHFPPKKPFAMSLRYRLKAFFRYSTTPLGFCVVLYGLNVVAWGGMIFLLLCNAAPAMCHPTCKDIDSPRRKWIEYDSQILNALFCVTGFGLAPWRFRDLYFLLKYRLRHDIMGLRKLAGIHRGWLRLPGSNCLSVHLGPDTISAVAGSYPEEAVPYPPSSIADAPRTGVRAPPTWMWKLDFVIWMNISNTFLQCCLSAFMWGYDRYTRPSWAVGLFVALAMTVATLAGVMVFVESRKVKGIEGIPVTEDDLQRLSQDRELGITHYNNLKDKKPKQDKEEIEVERGREAMTNN